ncbi:uncharacterized protein LOC120120290 [Hibiscus syriacus]|uniref:uncharacterized protein LOC120120290 n=1 Tax=Hibiscus syriacus TaxID=106335 RepID=UPI001921A154|nr:uncharacterized protein LOC120120290 [Hibiscus syriacus]
MEEQAKGAEDSVRKKSIYRSPPPPSPPPPMTQKPSSLKPVKSRKGGEVQIGRINGKAVRFDHQKSSRVEKLNWESVMELAQEKRVVVEKVMVETTTDDDSEIEEDGAGETPIVSSIERSPNNEYPSSGNNGGSDVDKKADEFIAKEREQIRLQRIDSIKRSSGQFKRNYS